MSVSFSLASENTPSSFGAVVLFATSSHVAEQRRPLLMIHALAMDHLPHRFVSQKSEDYIQRAHLCANANIQVGQVDEKAFRLVFWLLCSCNWHRHIDGIVLAQRSGLLVEFLATERHLQGRWLVRVADQSPDVYQDMM